MKRKIFRAVIALLALTGIVLIVIRFLPITYKGLALPKPSQVNSSILMPRPPAAWLIVGDEAVLASFGSSCFPMLIFGMGCGDAPAPQGRSDLATATLPAQTTAVIVIASTAVKEFHATVQPWTEIPNSGPPLIRELKAKSQRGINKTVFILEPLDDAGDLLLEMTVTFNRGEASYYWRLNPGTEPAMEPPSSPLRAVYLVQHPGQLSLDDLQAHPEVAVTTSFDEFKQYAQKKVALWIDENAVSLVDNQWLRESPQKYYPLVLVGESNDLCAFRETLTGFGIEGPPADCSAEASGFSVWALREETGSSLSAFMKGYSQTPTVQDILDITSALLEGKTK